MFNIENTISCICLVLCEQLTLGTNQLIIISVLSYYK